MITHEVAYYKNDDTTLLARVPNGAIPPVNASVSIYDTDGTTVLSKTVATVVYDLKKAPLPGTAPMNQGSTIVRVKLSA